MGGRGMHDMTTCTMNDSHYSTRHHRGSKNYALFFLNKRCLWGLKKRLDILFSADHLVLLKIQ